MNALAVLVKRLLLCLPLPILCACATGPDATQAPVEVKILAFNDLHGHLEPPGMALRAADGTLVPAGGAAYLAGAIAARKAQNPHHAVVSAGDMIGASPLLSALFLDEPTIEAVNAMEIDFHAVGNHEFDKGQAELLRVAGGGCQAHTARMPCRVSRDYAGARFGFLAANVLRADGSTLFPATGLKRFGSGAAAVTVGFIGMTLQGTPAIVSPSGVAGLRFADEADTANALVPQLQAQGADAIVVVIHEGLVPDGAPAAATGETDCRRLSGALAPILSRLTPAVDVVVSGHTHRAYTCDWGTRDPSRPFLLTSAGQYGTQLTEIDLRFDPRTRRLLGKEARNLIVQGEPLQQAGRTVPLAPHHPRFAADRTVSAQIARYQAAAGPLAERVVGRLTGPATRQGTPAGESVLGLLVADAQLAATRASERGGAQIALTNPGGVRADLQSTRADGGITYGQVFAAQPFGNSLVVRTFSGAQLRAVLEQQFDSGTNTVQSPRVLYVSQGFGYAYDLSRPPGQRVSDLRLHGRPVADGERLRVTVNSYLADGGDNFSRLREGGDALGGLQDVDALEAYLQAASPLDPPAPGRIRDLTPAR